MTGGMYFFSWLSEISGLSQGGIARRLGISPSLVSRIIKGERNFTLGLLQSIAKEFELPQEVVYAKAGILPAQYGQAGMDIILADRKKPAQNEDISETGGLRDEDSLRHRTIEYEKHLKRLKNVRDALHYALADKLPVKAINKMIKIIELEIRYHETM